MDIKNVASNIVNPRVNNDSVRNQEKADAKSSAVKSDDRVTLSQNLTQMRGLESQALNANTDRSARIAELRDQIANGTYQVNSQKVAEKLLATEALY